MSRRLTLTALLATSCALVLAAPAFAEPSAPSTPTYSASQLRLAMGSVSARLASPPDGVTSWGVDPASGRVTVSVVANDQTALKAARAAVAGVPQAKIVTVKQRNRPFYNLLGGQAIYAANDGRCSIGFSASNTAGTRYVLTAGHCTALGGTWTGFNRVTIGPVASSNYPTDDFGTIRVANTASWANTGIVVKGVTTVPVYGSTAAPIGASVCRSGSTTGYRCGVIQATNQTVNYVGGNIVYGLTRTNACAEPGDSGGSFLSTAVGTGGQAQGVVSGGSGNCTSGGTTFFQPVAEILQKNFLTLTTTTPTAGLCSDDNQGGSCGSYTVDVPDLRALTGGVGNDRANSVAVPTFRYLVLYKDINYAGTCQAFTGNRNTLTGTTIGSDTVSSFRIASTALGCPVG